MTENGRLACFSVYPASVSQGVLELFRDYDRALAAALGLEIYGEAEGEDEDGLEVATTVSVSWYDDSYWDLTVSEGSSGP